MADGATCKAEKASSCKGNINANEDLIRQGYKYYKSKKPPPDFSEVINFNNPDTFRGRVLEISLRSFPHAGHGLRCASEWKVYQLLSCPGFIFIVNPFLKGAQNYWTRRCIEDFTRKPNVSNLDAHMTIKENESAWELSR
jgi:alkylated DNA repair protein alkB family protein 1